jgi:Domain of unknown function DUF302
MAVDGLTSLRSPYGPQDTMDRLEAEVKSRGMTVFARIDHAEGAAGVGLALRPTELLIFGHAKAGTPLMQSVQTMGTDLPLKALVGRMPPARPGSPIMTLPGWRSGMSSEARPRRWWRICRLH